MGSNSSVFVLIFLHIFAWNLAGRTSSLSEDEQKELNCLRSIKDSLEGPQNRLTWTFNSSFCDFAEVTCRGQEYAGRGSSIISIQLREMALEGQFPRGLQNCTSLQDLDLSGNSLSGPLPSEIFGKLPNLATLDLSNNLFSGEIPSTIANCTYLDTLLLHNNQLTGQIPWQLGRLSGIKRFNVANNLLSGPVPSFPFVDFTRGSYANNSGLCGDPLKPCIELGWRSNESFKQGFVVGYVVFAVPVISVFMSYCVPWVHLKKGKKITMTEMILLMIRRKNNRVGADEEETY